MEGIYYVESRPISPEREAEYHAWYDVHIAEITAIEGFRSARRFAPIDDDGPYVTIYELEGDDLRTILATFRAISRSGKMTPAAAVQQAPPPVTRLLRVLPPGPGSAVPERDRG